MKKNILLILLSAGLLTGCSLDLGIVKIGGDSNKEEKTSEKDEEKPGNPGDIDENEDKFTAIIETCGDAIQDVAVGYGTQIDSDLESGKTAAQRLSNCLKAQVSKSECFTSVWFEKLNTADYGADRAIIQIGTGNYSRASYKPGTFKWNSSAKIYKVEVQAYAFVNYPNVDEYAKLNVNGESFTLHEEGDGIETLKTFSKEFSSGTNSLTLISESGRVFLKSLTITWKI